MSLVSPRRMQLRGGLTRPCLVGLFWVCGSRCVEDRGKVRYQRVKLQVEMIEFRSYPVSFELLGGMAADDDELGSNQWTSSRSYVRRRIAYRMLPSPSSQSPVASRNMFKSSVSLHPTR